MIPPRPRCGSSDDAYHPHQELVKQLADLNKTWRKEHGFGKLTIAEVLRFPEVLADQSEDPEKIGRAHV